MMGSPKASVTLPVTDLFCAGSSKAKLLNKNKVRNLENEFMCFD